MPSGLDNPGSVDEVRDADGAELVVHAWGEWDGSDHRQLLLQEKLNRYLEYVVDGELAAASARRWVVVVEHDHVLDDRTRVYLRHADAELRRRGGGVEVRMVTPPS